LGIGGIALVGAAVAVAVWAVGQLSQPKTDGSGFRSDDVEQAAGPPANSASGPLARAAAQVAPPVGAASTPVSPAAPASTLPAPQTGAAASPSPAAAPPSIPAPATVLAPAAPAAGQMQMVDVLHQINPPRDAARGAWMFLGTNLASPRNEVGVLRLPVTPPVAYRLTLVVERIAPVQPVRTFTVPPQPSQPRSPSRTRPSRGRTTPSRIVPQPAQETPQPQPQPASDEGLDIVLSVDGHPAELVLDGWQRTTSGMELIDGKGVD
jgi:hypothetical protein